MGILQRATKEAWPRESLFLSAAWNQDVVRRIFKQTLDSLPLNQILIMKTSMAGLDTRWDCKISGERELRCSRNIGKSSDRFIEGSREFLSERLI